MNDEPRVEQLVNEMLESGRTPEEVCADCPELMAEVRKRLGLLRIVEAELDAMFPTPDPNRDANGTSESMKFLLLGKHRQDCR
jgi:serine/threonine-protein kinase